MNKRILGRSYKVLSLRERFLLFTKASERGDESEMRTILAASPKTAYQITDFYNLFERFNNLHFINLLERLKYQEKFDLVLEKVMHLDNSKLDDFERNTKVLFLIGYLYAIETDAWSCVCEEFGFDANEFRRISAKDLLTFKLLESKDKRMRKIAFSTEGINRMAEELNLNPIEIKTLETQKAKYRTMLYEAEEDS